ncbi:hypothetical protein PVAP13_6NG168300 [Panicum virgatum]|uniref:Uncharacterized protein n=1 Tax=Panicum virgatum TaxID=38727 RepID=A0A8T0R134_PANVG|nr:hypothetical protein PVAP13_J683327 [Panicum virgatum]KAG2578935.1 hypothetical protein PVAP13_6NG168300 [Panicum virgatum]
MEAEPAVVGQAPMSSAEVVSKVLYHNSSNNTFLKNVGILMISTKIEKSTEKTLQKEQSTAQQISTSLHHEVDELKKNSKITEQALANTQRELEVFKKQMEENNLLLNRILHLNNAGIS